MVQYVSEVVKIAGQVIERSTLTGLKAASAKSGISFQYLVAKAAQESNLKANARATTSSAKGLFQFTRGTWLDMMNRFGEHYGYGELAAKISVGPDGRAAVNDPVAERRVLDLRQDPEASALMTAEYARGNAESLQGALGRGLDASDLYLAHFLGATGASRLLTAVEDFPETIAADMLPAAAKANGSVFYAADERARTVAEVADLIRGRFSDQMDRYVDVASAWAEQDTAQSVPGGKVASKSNTDFQGNMNWSNPYAMAVSWVVLEEMTKLTASSPMTMFDSSESEDDGEDPYATSSPGFQGQDFAAALMQSVKSSIASHKELQRASIPDHQRSAAAYEARYTPAAAPRLPGGRGSDRA